MPPSFRWVFYLCTSMKLHACGFCCLPSPSQQICFDDTHGLRETKQREVCLRCSSQRYNGNPSWIHRCMFNAEISSMLPMCCCNAVQLNRATRFIQPHSQALTMSFTTLTLSPALALWMNHLTAREISRARAQAKPLHWSELKAPRWSWCEHSIHFHGYADDLC